MKPTKTAKWAVIEHPSRGVYLGISPKDGKPKFRYSCLRTEGLVFTSTKVALELLAKLAIKGAYVYDSEEGITRLLQGQLSSAKSKLGSSSVDERRVVWIRVRYIREEDMPVYVSADLSDLEARRAAESAIAARSPETRLSPAAKIKWEYKVIATA